MLSGRVKAKTASELLALLISVGVVVGASSLTVSGGAAFAYGEVGYVHTDGTVRKSQRDGTYAEAACQALCIAAAGVADAAAGMFIVVPGVITGLSGGTAGALAYLSATAGAIGTIPSEGSGHFAVVIGRWLSATVLVFNPEPPNGPI